MDASASHSAGLEHGSNTRRKGGAVSLDGLHHRRLVQLDYQRSLRVVEPHAYGVGHDGHELLRAWELIHRHRAAECVTQHTLFRKETRWPGYYYRGDVMKLDDENWHVLTVSRRDPETGEYTMEKAPCYHLVDDKPEAEARV